MLFKMDSDHVEMYKDGVSGTVSSWRGSYAESSDKVYLSMYF